MRKYNLQIPSILIKGFNDLGDEITEEFRILYHRFFTQGKIQLTSSFINKSKELFSKFDDQEKTSYSDRYFENFTPIKRHSLRMGNIDMYLNFGSRSRFG